MISKRVYDCLSLNIKKRDILIESLQSQGISEITLMAMKKIPREYFLSSELYYLAYEDRALPIDEQQTISQPFTVAFMTDLLDIVPDMKVLEIGTGSGYQSLILNALGAEVFTIERIANLHNKAFVTFKDFDADINCFVGDGSEGLESYSPYDRIIVTAGAPYVPEKLKMQLKVGGILVIPVGDKEGQTMLKIIRINTQDYQEMEFNKFRFVPLIGNLAWRG
jgi:protein-L-isoaspartate(D-aspartate) O-methyltransferase